ncbi:hypothetical protein [Wolbachia endosymbiont of Wuchereria bancrofti]|nr:hypothetical protein [Wolbachia endosymbiont of Wuchereria bancrofti]
MASAGVVLKVTFSPLVVFATLIMLVAVRADYIGIRIGKAVKK